MIYWYTDVACIEIFMKKFAKFACAWWEELYKMFWSRHIITTFIFTNQYHRLYTLQWFTEHGKTRQVDLFCFMWHLTTIGMCGICALTEELPQNCLPMKTRQWGGEAQWWDRSIKDERTLSKYEGNSFGMLIFGYQISKVPKNGN